VDCRFDSDIVRRAAKLRPQYQFEIFGGSQIVDHGNLRYRGSIPYDDLPSVLRSAKVGILPLSDYPSNKGRSPMKLFEYLSSGLTVVAPDYIAERHPGLPAIFGYTAGSLESFVVKVVSAIASQDVPMNIADSQIPDSVDWENKATELMTFARYAAQKREPVE
jgi:teichuronic acid biosynthesis glycosyltransferase TuaH